MANPDIPRGLLPYAHYDGSVWNGSANLYYVPAGYGTALFIGDPVDIIAASNDAVGTPAVRLATVGSPIVGTVVGIAPGPGGITSIPVLQNMPIYHPANTAQYILVADDPTLLFMVQDNAAAQAVAPNLWPGQNANLVAAAGSTVTGYSGWELAANTVADTNTLDVKILRALNQPDNTVGTVANTNMNAKWLVKLNNYRYDYQTAGVAS